jgi:hypothetical protein
MQGLKDGSVEVRFRRSPRLSSHAFDPVVPDTRTPELVPLIFQSASHLSTYFPLGAMRARTRLSVSFVFIGS